MRHVPDVTTMVTLLQESANQVAGTVPCPNSVYLLILFFKNLNCNFYSCYCVDINNNRIFGESPPSYAATDAAMNCGMCPSQKNETKNN